MAQQMIRGGAPVDIPTPAEVADAVDVRMRAFYDQQSAIEDARQRERLRGIKAMDLPMMRGTISGAAITLGPQKGQVCGPESGYAWSVLALVVNGLASGATPDVLNFYKNDTGQPVWWQLNGNQFGETFSKLQRVLYAGESLAAASSGALAATGTITVTGTIIEVPAERLGELA
jgi:hypothetical protein